MRENEKKPTEQPTLDPLEKVACRLLLEVLQECHAAYPAAGADKEADRVRAMVAKKDYDIGTASALKERLQHIAGAINILKPGAINPDQAIAVVEAIEQMALLSHVMGAVVVRKLREAMKGK